VKTGGLVEGTNDLAEETMSRRTARQSAAPAARRMPAPTSRRPAPAARRQAAIERSHRAALAAGIAAAAELAALTRVLEERLIAAIGLAVAAIRAGNQILFCGNGGSSAEAAHLAAELAGRFYYDRAPLHALALNDSVPALTAVANDYGYEFVFARQLNAIGRPGDVLVALTTSGRSPNVLTALAAARAAGIRTIGLTGRRGRRFAAACDVGFVVESDDTARIQEIHLLLGHLLCARIEAELFPRVPTRSGRS
jgi:D-sedoheptulose 7-phosphate isomerase